MKRKFLYGKPIFQFGIFEF